MLQVLGIYPGFQLCKLISENKRRKWLLLFSFIVFTLSTFAQSAAIDSLKVQLDMATEDTTRILIAGELAAHLNEFDKDSALTLLGATIPLAQKIGFRNGLLKLYQTTAYTLSINNESDSALIMYQMAIDLADEMKAKNVMTQTMKDYGTLLNDLNRKEEAIAIFERALLIAKELKDTHLQTIFLNKIGNVYSYLAQYHKADSVINLAYQLQLKLGNGKRMASCLGNLGNNAARWNKLDKALTYYEMAAQLLREAGDYSREAMVYRMVGYSASVLGDYPLSIDYFQKSLAIFEDLDDVGGITNCLDNMAETYLSMEDYDEALLYFEKAADTWEKSGKVRRNTDIMLKRANVFSLKGECGNALNLYFKAQKWRRDQKESGLDPDHFLRMGLCYERLGNRDSAIFFIDKSIGLASGKNDFIMKSEGLIELGRLYRNQGKDQKALVALSEAIETAQVSGLKDKEMEAAELLYHIYKAQNIEGLALKYFEIHRAIQDTLFSKKNIKEIARIEARAELEKEKQRLAFEKQ